MPAFEVYFVSPLSMERMPACRTRGGVIKSGSPIPSEITSVIVAAISKNRRMPEGGMDCTRFEMVILEAGN